MKRVILLMVTALAAGPVLAQTAPPIKPGLWQVHSEREIDGKKAPDLGEQLKGMSPAMRERMAANMKQHGIDISGPPGQMKICQTREALDAGKWQGEQGQCKTDFGSRSNSAWKWKSTCSQPESVTVGEAAFANPENYTVKSTTTMAMQGQSHVTRMTLKAKWLGGDCGDLKPMQPPPAAPPQPKQ
ncbi:MAG TPA: DUF3617 domain-containing protein [Rhizobacter sp.]|nr:DUF3617 domain-containing protein [Rhizobacter sp.]